MFCWFVCFFRLSVRPSFSPKIVSTPEMVKAEMAEMQKVVSEETDEKG